MMNTFKKLLNNQKGLTLVELLVVIVVLGIVSAIAVPSVGGILNNAKKDGHIANAQQMVSSARLAMTVEEDFTSDNELTLQELVENGYLEAVPEDPSNKGNTYDKDSKIAVSQDGNNNYSYTVTLALDDAADGISKLKYIDAITPDQLTRTNVDLK